ncbi:MAG: SIR2 family protein [Brevundimonas sp.]|uniref:SIR2 family protein n=1 Tax=Brevundimonas sp. TaxID=1871086 RepID=UPI003002ECA4
MRTTVKLPEFAERLRERLVDNQQDVVWFLGAGCSISSGIKAAGGLVDDWLNKLHEMRAPDHDRNDWARSAFKGFDPKKPALHYAEIFESRHPNAADRQQEIERICAGGEAAYGYATLAQIITDTRIGPRCNMVLTTNFDDLLVEAIYMYGALQVRPQIITHEAVVHYARVSQTRPTIIKLHGDAHLDPKNLRHETARLDPTVSEHLHALVKNATLVFLGYGGNDQSIVRFLTDCPRPTLPQPVYWVGTDDPSAEMSQWLDDREAVRVNHRDFDDAMHLVRLRLEIPHPEESRWTRARDRYLDALKSYTTDKKADRDPETRKALKEATEQSSQSTPASAWAFMISALEAHDDPDRAEAIYKEGIGRFGDDANLLGTYALFLIKVRKDMDGAEALYKRALDAEPDDADTLGDYALFLKQVRKDMDGAEALYKRALEAEPDHTNNLRNYALFLWQVRKDMDGAEAPYKRALDAEPDNADTLSDYALFLKQVRKDMDGAVVGQFENQAAGMRCRSMNMTG